MAVNASHVTVDSRAVYSSLTVNTTSVTVMWSCVVVNTSRVVVNRGHITINWRVI